MDVRSAKSSVVWSKASFPLFFLVISALKKKLVIWRKYYFLVADGLRMSFWAVYVILMETVTSKTANSLYDRSLKMFSKCLCLCLFVGHVSKVTSLLNRSLKVNFQGMSPHHSHHMCPGRQVSHWPLIRKTNFTLCLHYEHGWWDQVFFSGKGFSIFVIGSLSASNI